MQNITITTSKPRMEIILCECSSAEHQIILRSFPEDDNEIYITYHLGKLPLWERVKYGVKYGVKYIFGYQSKYGAFGELITTKTELLEKVSKL